MNFEGLPYAFGSAIFSRTAPASWAGPLPHGTRDNSPWGSYARQHQAPSLPPPTLLPLPPFLVVILLIRALLRMLISPPGFLPTFSGDEKRRLARAVAVFHASHASVSSTVPRRAFELIFLSLPSGSLVPPVPRSPAGGANSAPP